MDGDELGRWITSPEATEWERQLLRSWVDERPSPAARTRTLAALGLLTTVAVSFAPKALGPGWLAFAKWIGLATLASLMGVGVVVLRHRTPQPVNTVTIELPARPLAPPVAREAPRSVEQGGLSITDLPLAQQSNLPLAKGSPEPEGRVGDSLAAQLAMVDRARAALQRGEATVARKLVDDYELAYPSGVLVQEAEAVRVEALVRARDHEAARVGERFLTTYPRSPHAARIRKLLHDAE